MSAERLGTCETTSTSCRSHALVQRNKACPEPVEGLDRKFGALYDKMYRSDVLWEAWLRVKKNTGAPGIDGQSLEYIEQVIGVVPFLKELQEELRSQEYDPEPVLRHWIPKPGTTDKRP